MDFLDEKIIENAADVLCELSRRYESETYRCIDGQIYQGDIKSHRLCFNCICSNKCEKCCPPKSKNSSRGPIDVGSILKSIPVHDGFMGKVQVMMSELCARELFILIVRFGLFGFSKHSLEMVGKFYGVTRERIRGIEVCALEKLDKNKYMKELLQELN